MEVDVLMCASSEMHASKFEEGRIRVKIEHVGRSPGYCHRYFK